GRRVSPLFKVNSVAKHNGPAERETRLRAVPGDELADRVVVGALAAERRQAVQHRRLGVSLPIGDEGNAPDRVLGTYISADAFRLVRQAPLVGRVFLPEEDRTSAHAVVVLGYAVWQTRYAGDRDVAGRTVIVNGVPSTVVGVMPQGFGFPNDADLWLPLASMP